MAITNQERVGKAMEILRDGLRPFIEWEMLARLGDAWAAETEVREVATRTEQKDCGVPSPEWSVAVRSKPPSLPVPCTRSPALGGSAVT